MCKRGGQISVFLFIKYILTLFSRYYDCKSTYIIPYYTQNLFRILNQRLKLTNRTIKYNTVRVLLGVSFNYNNNYKI